MYDQEIEQLLQTLKNDPALGGDFDVQKSWNLVSNKCGFASSFEKEIKYGWRDWLEFYIHDTSRVILKPAMAVALFAFLFVGGWVGSMNASMNALPGEKLYSLKTGLEKVQLSLAVFDDQRAKLHMEFAGRRLDEMVALSASSSNITNVANSAKQEVANVKDELTNNTELAKAVGRKADVYSSTISGTRKLSVDMQKKVAEVQQVIDETKDQAVDVMISANEQSTNQDNKSELAQEFSKQYAHAKSISTSKDISQLALAEKLAGEGVYRRAFQILKEIEVAHK